MAKDYFSFETIRDRNGDVICYHVTAIGTIEKDGVTRMRSDMGGDGDKKMAFGKLTIRGKDRMIGLLLRETGSRAYWRSTDEDGPYCILSFAAREKHAEEVYNFNEGDRVLIEGRAYVRQNTSSVPDRLPELSITVNSTFVLGRKRRPQTMTSSIIPQKRHSAAEEENPDDAPMMSFEPQGSSTMQQEEPEAAPQEDIA